MTTLAEAGLRTRQVRGESKRYIRSLGHLEGRRELAAMLMDGVPKPLRKLHVDEAMQWCSHVGSSLAEHFMTKAEIPLTATLGELTQIERQRLGLVLCEVAATTERRHRAAA